ncbi:MAG TPA: aminotransferase class I/II-fold pyridoxal phosphate-dependent enzyme, partial [Kofleriaceae bacterium]|nr:aminotransferase class I/II-fold pyridoxal phosphate-dependent enzyme [Kofleriaceae bacterium]
AIVLGAGASELIDRVLGVVLRPGERLVAHTPSWPLFPRLCAARMLDAITVPYRLANDRVDHDLDAVLAAVDGTVRLVYLISPANPVGCALDAAPFARFLAALPPHVTVVVDEAYGEFVVRPDAVRAPAVTRTDPRVIAIRTFSKFHALAGLRLGYAVAAPGLSRALAAAALPFGVTAAAAYAAIAAIGDRDHARRTLAAIERGRALCPTALPSDAPFALAPVPGVPRYFAGRYAMVPLWPNET